MVLLRHIIGILLLSLLLCDEGYACSQREAIPAELNSNDNNGSLGMTELSGEKYDMLGPRVRTNLALSRVFFRDRHITLLHSLHFGNTVPFKFTSCYDQCSLGTKVHHTPLYLVNRILLI
jgi:hypothetical protein